jgi:hypothetical protein
MEAVVLIPLTYNDGTKVPPGTIESIYDQLYRSFHGWTTEGTVRGAYRMRSGQRRVEKLLKFSVILDEVRLPALEAMVAAWCAQLGQEGMLLKVTDATVRLVPPRGEEERS